MARRGDEFQPEPLEIVEGVVQRVDFQLAAIARSGINLADGEAAAEPALRGTIEIAGKLGEPGSVGAGAASVTGRLSMFLNTSRMTPSRDRGPNRSS